MRCIPVGIRARIYRATVALGALAVSTSTLLAAIDQPYAAFVVAAGAGVLGSLAAVLAAVFTPLDFDDDKPAAVVRYKPGD